MRETSSEEGEEKMEIKQIDKPNQKKTNSRNHPVPDSSRGEEGRQKKK